jgi:hypothetical protein
VLGFARKSSTSYVFISSSLKKMGKKIGLMAFILLTNEN